MSISGRTHFKGVTLQKQIVTMNAETALRHLKNDGGLLLAGCVSLKNTEPLLINYAKRQDMGVIILRFGGLDSYYDEETPVDPAIMLNDTIREILSHALEDGAKFLILNYSPGILFPGLPPEVMGRDPDWRRLKAMPGFVAMDCIFLGGDRDARWSFDIEEEDGTQSKSRISTIEAYGGDCLVWSPWLWRSMPRLVSPLPASSIGEFYIKISYVCRNLKDQLSRSSNITAKVGTEVMNMTGGQVKWREGFLEWVPH